MAERASLIPYLPEPYRIRRRLRETADTWTLELEPTEGGEVFAYEPGQFKNDGRLFGAGEVLISISGDPARRDRLVHTIRVVSPTTRAVCELKRRHPGDPWSLRPRGRSREAEGGDPSSPPVDWARAA